MNVNAMAATEKGAPLTAYPYDAGNLAPFDCRVRVTFCGVCHSDLHMIDNDWGMSRYPLVPGHEVVGEVIEVGSAVAHVHLGDRVGIGWQRASCLQCRACLGGNENLCDHSRGTITHGFGGFADVIQADSRFCFPIPAGIASVNAGPLLCGGVTVYAGLRYAGMSSGQEIGVLGVGGLGHMAVQFAAKLGNRVTAFTSSPDKSEFAKQLGATDVESSTPVAPRRRGKPPLDILLVTAPLEFNWDSYLKLLGPDGTLVFVGIPPKPLALSPSLLLAKRRRVMASPTGGRAILAETLDIAERFEIEPIVETYPLAKVNEAIDRLRSNRVRYRAVLEA